MSSIFKVLTVAIVSFVLVALSFLLGGESISSLHVFWKWGPESLVAWVVLIGCAVTLNFLSAWYKIWVAPLCCALFAGIAFFVGDLLSLSPADSLLFVGVYGLWAASMVFLVKQEVSVFGVSTIAFPGWVSLGLPLVIEAVLLWQVFPDGGHSNLLGLALGAGIGLIFASFSFYMPAVLRSRIAAICCLSVEGRKAPLMVEPEPEPVAVDEDPVEDEFVFPVGDAPGVSVLQEKLGRVSSVAPKRTVTRDKIMAEDQI